MAPEIELRQRIVRASVELLDEQGLGALSMREVARRAGVSHQAPYHHFADREAIVAAIAEEGFDILGAALTEALRASTPRTLVAALARAYVSFALEHGAHFRLMFRPELCNVERYPSAHAAATRCFGLLQAMVASLTEEWPRWKSREGELATVAWSVAHGYASLLIDGPLISKLPNAKEPAAIAAVVDVIAAALLGALGNAPPKRR